MSRLSRGDVFSENIRIIVLSKIMEHGEENIKITMLIVHSVHQLHYIVKMFYYVYSCVV